MAVDLERTTALGLTTDLEQAGAVFNDATRLLDGGLWNAPNANNQNPYQGMFTTDLHAEAADIAAMLATPASVTVGGNAITLTAADLSALGDVQTQINDMLAQAAHAVGNGPGAIAAQAALHADDLAVLNDINNDPNLASALGNNQYAGNTGAMDAGFQALPVGADDAGALAAAAAGATLTDVGNVFNAATDLAVGGLHSTNLSEFNNDMQAVATGLTNILASPTELAAIENGEAADAAALTTIHLQTVLNQINEQINQFDPEYASNPNVAARSTNDNVLDIIDIIQNDPNLNTAAGGNGTPGHAGGFSEVAGYLTGTITKYQDNQAQTNFWAQFLAEANTGAAQLNTAAGGGDTVAQLQALVSQLQAYQEFGANFAQSQGGIFGARFDNELLSGTLLADTNAAVTALNDAIANNGVVSAADAAMMHAAGSGFQADAMDVSGNNVPIGGGTYVGTATTVATATSPNGLATGTIPVPAGGSGGGGATSGAGGSPGGPGPGSSHHAGGPGGPGHNAGDPGPGPAAGEHHHFEHIWHHV
jgi:hypothetical protein